MSLDAEKVFVFILILAAVVALIALSRSGKSRNKQPPS
jgi:hypothetical protein